MRSGAMQGQGSAWAARQPAPTASLWPGCGAGLRLHCMRGACCTTACTCPPGPVTTRMFMSNCCQTPERGVTDTRMLRIHPRAPHAPLPPFLPRPLCLYDPLHLCKLPPTPQQPAPLALYLGPCGSSLAHRHAFAHPATPSPHLSPTPQDDLVCLPAKQAAALGNIGPMVLVTRVTNAITLTDPLTLRQGEGRRPRMHSRGRVPALGGLAAPPSTARCPAFPCRPPTAALLPTVACRSAVCPLTPSPTRAPALVCPRPCPAAVLEAPAYWRNPLKPMMGSRQLTEFYILDSEVAQQGEPAPGPSAGGHAGRQCSRAGVRASLRLRSGQRRQAGSCPPRQGRSRHRRPALFTPAPCPAPRRAGGYGAGSNRYALATCEVARAADFGSNDRTFFARTHLGHLLHAGDTAVGYDVANANLVDPELEKAMHKVGPTLPPPPQGVRRGPLARPACSALLPSYMPLGRADTLCAGPCWFGACSWEGGM